ncbi:MAG: UvrB/UvrC motif-containing protein [Candidatus Edwardsbacteria bacterium]
MLCEFCGEEEATVHLTELVNGKISEFHLCVKCAEKKGVQSPSLSEPFSSLGALLSGVIEELALNEPVEKGTTCPGCGASYFEFKKTGRLGCPKCYNTFQKQLKSLLRKIHGNTRHTGKRPVIAPISAVPAQDLELEKLKKELTKAIEKEEFERAAELRDKIKQGGTKNNG